MKRTCPVVIVALSLFGCADPNGAVEDSYRVLDIPSIALGAESTVRLALHEPAGVPDAVIVFLHGVGGSEHSWAELGGPEALKPAAQTGSPHPPAVLVVAVGGDSLGWPEHLDGSVSWEHLLVDELPAYLRSEYGEHLINSRIAYLGTSAGGSKALSMAFKHPASFACVAAHSPALHPPDPGDLPDWARAWEGWKPLYGLPIDEARWRAGNVIHLATTADAESLADLGIYFDVGADDHLGFQHTAARLTSVLADRGVPHEFALRVGGHGSDFTSSNLPKSITFLIRCLGQRLALEPHAF